MINGKYHAIRIMLTQSNYLSDNGGDTDDCGFEDKDDDDSWSKVRNA